MNPTKLPQRGVDTFSTETEINKNPQFSLSRRIRRSLSKSLKLNQRKPGRGRLRQFITLSTGKLKVIRHLPKSYIK